MRRTLLSVLIGSELREMHVSMMSSATETDGVMTLESASLPLMHWVRIAVGRLGSTFLMIEFATLASIAAQRSLSACELLTQEMHVRNTTRASLVMDVFKILNLM